MTKRQLLPATTVDRSRGLRKAMGEPERRLWRALREALPAVKFRRQVPFGRYHADFCSHSAELIVEVDGDDHVARQGRDTARTRFLESEGYRVIRFGNAHIIANIDGVLASIAIEIDKQRGRP